MADTLEEKVLDNHIYNESHMTPLWLKAKAAGNKKDRLFKIVTAVDNGEQWSIYKNKIRRSQSLPVSNILSSIRDTRQGALSTTGFVGEFISESLHMDPMIPALNDLFTDWWKRAEYDQTIEDVTEDMLTYGTGIVLVSSSGRSVMNAEAKQSVINDIVLTAIEPSSLYVEPGAKNEREANYYFIKDTATFSYLKTIPMFKNALEANKDKIASAIRTQDSGVSNLPSNMESESIDNESSDFLTYIGRAKTTTGERWDMVYTFAGIVIHKIIGIQPNVNPLVFVREKRDKKSFWGQSTYKHNLAMQLAINEVDSAVITHAKKQQDPVAFAAKDSGLNISDFTKNRDQPGAVFAINSNSRKAVEYAQVPNLPTDISNMSAVLTDRIRRNTGVGDIATGQGSGSLQTAGGISQILGRATLKDVKVANQIRRFYVNLYKVIIEHVKMKHGFVRYAAKDHVENEMQYKVLNLDQIDWNSISIIVDITNHTKEAKISNTQIISEMFQQSVQYSSAQPITEPVIMTADEYLQGLKEPNLHRLIDQIMNRRRKEREIDMAGIATQIVQIYLQLVSQGIAPQEAIMHVAQEFSSDPGILKGMQVSELAKQQEQAQQPGSMDGGNVGQAQTGGAK